jgi:short-subunit dehydrogenase
MKPIRLSGQWTLVTGASAGLGREMARQLARDHRSNVIVVARRADRLADLKAEIESGAGVSVEPIVADLSKIEDVDRVIGQATAGRQIAAAILNAGVTHFGPHEALEWQEFETMLHTNVTGTVRMANALVPHLEKHADGGALMLVSSMAGLTPLPYQTAYSATKAFVTHFGIGLAYELKARTVSVTTYAPGGIATEMTAGEQFGPLRGWMMDERPAARDAIKALVGRRRLAIPGFANRLGAVAMRLLPQSLVTGRIAATYRAALEKTGRLGPRVGG